MIAFDLQCSHGHRFEGWFADSQVFETQRDQGLIGCPRCGDTLVCRIPSTFAIRSPSAPAPAALPPQREILHLVRQVAEYVHDHFEDVGCDFAKEALKIHYGASEPRNIRGISSVEEEKTLKQEGVAFIKLPLPEAPESET
jgi:hypothetical protein